MQNELTNIKFRRLDPQFFVVLRTIIDSYWNHYHLNDDFRLVQRFPEFVYQWFSHFTIDRSTRKVRLLTEIEQERSDEFMMKFILDMMSPQLIKIWEVK
jgi:hypothetical protein